jgi:preprotein translocase subunit SecE
VGGTVTTLKSKASEDRAPLDLAKLILAALILGAGIVGFYWYENAAQVYRILGLLVAVLVPVGLILTTRLGRGIMSFGRESRIELRKVIWPTRQETLQTTLVVLVVVLIVAIFLWLLDMILRWAVAGLTGIGV